jgi:hypothetical protein
MRNFTLGLVCCIPLLLMCGIAGCISSGASGTDKIYPPDPITVALPFVEAIHIPTEIHAGQPFTITVDFSSALNPTALRCPVWPPNRKNWVARDLNVEGGQTVYKYYAEFWPYRDLTQASGNLPAQTSVAYNFEQLPAGVHTLRYFSAPSHEQGGMNIQFDRNTGSEIGFSPGTGMSMEFTVLP